MFFHSFDAAGEMHWQGEVLDDRPDGALLVQLFSWWTGAPTDQVVALRGEQQGWHFYKTRGAWLQAGQNWAESRGLAKGRGY